MHQSPNSPPPDLSVHRPLPATADGSAADQEFETLVWERIARRNALRQERRYAEADGIRARSLSPIPPGRFNPRGQGCSGALQPCRWWVGGSTTPNPHPGWPFEVSPLRSARVRTF